MGKVVHQVRVSEEALAVAREFRRMFGPPMTPIPYDSAAPMEPELLSQVGDLARTEWDTVKNYLMNHGTSPSKVNRLLGGFEPVKWDGETLTLKPTRVKDMKEYLKAVQLLEDEAEGSFCVIVG